MHKLLFFISLALLLSACYAPLNSSKPYQYSSVERTPKGIPSKPGACYAKCIMSDVYKTNSEELFLFTGDPQDTDVEIRNVEIVVSEGGSKWVKKKVENNCRSANPDDCLVWCLVDAPREVENYVVVADTSATDQYELFIRETKELLSQGGAHEWREVVCEEKISKDIILGVQKFLTESGFYFGTVDGAFDQGVKDALVNFQTEFGLAKGQLTLETLDVMGVRH